jgi:nitrate/TMAO reductase-like tetraheme cytochrome c subunit
MKRLVLIVVLILVMIGLAAGCAEKEPAVTPEEGVEVVSSCVSCHSDKDLLKEVASPELEEKSEETSGEG